MVMAREWLAIAQPQPAQQNQLQQSDKVEGTAARGEVLHGEASMDLSTYPA
jgi:hypothetical protein